MDSLELKRQELVLLEQKIHLQTNLPHLHGWKFYQWAKDYWDSVAKEQFICAANQISKSSTQIRKHIHWATSPELWPSLWNTRPLVFWYLYPSRDVAHVEWEKKIKPLFMPRGEYKDHPIYGWKQELYHNRIFAIHWNSGISTYFKTYAQDVSDLQTGTVWKMDLDEETPEELMSELSLRMAATDGYLSAVFTPTTGQEYWRQAIEGEGDDRKFPNSFRRQVSMYDCLQYADGSNSPWTMEKINRAINACKSDAEVQRRIFGKFVIAEGLKYPSFSRQGNRRKSHFLPKDWSIWCGVDIGSGGDENHPAAISLVGVSPDWRQGRVFKGWRGDNEITTVPDIVKKTIDMTKDLNAVKIHYDWASADFFNIATGMGLVVERAEKSHAIGEDVLNALFKNHMLMIYDDKELDPLVAEIATLKNSTPKRKAKDDFTDSLRYAVTKVPWDWDAIRSDKVLKNEEDKQKETPEQRSIRERTEFWDGKKVRDVVDEIDEWNDLMYGSADDG